MMAITMRVFSFIMVVVISIICIGCKSRLSDNQTINLDSGMNIQIREPNTRIVNEQEREELARQKEREMWGDTPADSISILMNTYMREFIEWEERVGVQQMLGWKLYPAWYGGFFIENGKMVFLLTSENGVKTLPKGATWILCKYSHNDLVALDKEIGLKIKENFDRLGAIGSYVDDKKNRLVYNTNGNKEVIQFFKEHIYDGDKVIVR